MEPSSPILAALYRGDREAADAAAERAGALSLPEAAALGRDEELRRLLGADPAAANRRTEDGFTPIHLAAFFPGGADAVATLLEHGAQPGGPAANDSAVTPLHSAAAQGNRAAAAALLDAGAPVEAAQKGGYTALHSAAGNGDAELVDLLLDRGADLFALSDDKARPSDLAAARGHAELANKLRGIEQEQRRSG